MADNNREFDVVIFGASGFTGQFVVEEMAISVNMEQLYKTNNIRWAIAGRSKEKLENVLSEAEKNISIGGLATQVPIIEADISNQESILNMCKKTRLVINVVGPYRFYGEPVVKACVEAKTHHVCICGEPQFLEQMQLKYYDAAREAGVYIVGACGWDSIPADVGTTFTKQNFNGDLSGVDIIVSTKNTGAGGSASINYGTWHSAIYGYAHEHELKPIRKKLFDNILPLPKTRNSFPPKKIPLMGTVEGVKGFCLPFLGSDKSVVRRSEIYKYNKFHERPVSCETYVTMPSKAKCIFIVVVAAVFGLMAKFSCGRSLLKKYPGFFTFGFVSNDGVPRSHLKNYSFSHTIIGYGWDEKYEDIDRQHSDPPKKMIVTRVSGPYDPGYFGTAVLLVHSGMTLLFDKHKLPEPGVLSPGACYRDSYLIDRLSKRNVVFEVIYRSQV